MGALQRKRVTSADVAKASGVSRTTVSFVLNNTPDQRIGEATRERVLRVARELGYVPHAAARALAKGSTKLVAVDVGSIPVNEYLVGEYLAALSTRLEEYGVTVIVHGARQEGCRSLVRLAQAVQPFAIISYSSELVEAMDELRSAGVEMVLNADHESDTADLHWNHEVARLQLQHLRDRGHTRLAYCPPTRPELVALGRQRSTALHVEARQLGMELLPSLQIGSDRPSTRRQAVEWRRGNPQATALACFNDDVAIAVLGVLWDMGVRVPDDLAVIGVDDRPDAQYTVPALTTLRSDAVSAARRLADAFLQSINEDVPLEAHPPVEFTLIAREST